MSNTRRKHKQRANEEEASVVARDQEIPELQEALEAHQPKRSRRSPPSECYPGLA